MTTGEINISGLTAVKWKVNVFRWPVIVQNLKCCSVGLLMLIMPNDVWGLPFPESPINSPVHLCAATEPFNKKVTETGVFPFPLQMLLSSNLSPSLSLSHFFSLCFLFAPCFYLSFSDTPHPFKYSLLHAFFSSGCQWLIHLNRGRERKRESIFSANFLHHKHPAVYHSSALRLENTKTHFPNIRCFLCPEYHWAHYINILTYIYSELKAPLWHPDSV